MSKPSLNFAAIKKRYDIDFEDYAVLMYHPVTTEIHVLEKQIKEVVNAVIKSNINFIVVQPNNDTGHKIILNQYKKFIDNPRIKMFSSIRFEFFLEILRKSKFLIGNSSAGIHEAPVMALPSINIGTRQQNRFNHDTIINCDANESSILNAIKKTDKIVKIPSHYFGDGQSAKNFIRIINDDYIWSVSTQKVFNKIESGELIDENKIL